MRRFDTRNLTRNSTRTPPNRNVRVQFVVLSVLENSARDNANNAPAATPFAVYKTECTTHKQADKNRTNNHNFPKQYCTYHSTTFGSSGASLFMLSAHYAFANNFAAARRMSAHNRAHTGKQFCLIFPILPKGMCQYGHTIRTAACKQKRANHMHAYAVCTENSLQT